MTKLCTMLRWLGWVGLTQAFFSTGMTKRTSQALRLASWWLALGLLLGGGAVSVAHADPVPPEEAYPARAYRLDEQQLVVEFSIRPRYYLYRHSLRVEPLSPGLRLGEIALPAGEKKRDDYFGEVEVFHNALRLTVPVLSWGEEIPRLLVRSQGCWEGGVCYPPLEQELTVAAAPPASGGWLTRLFAPGAPSVPQPSAASSAPPTAASETNDREAATTGAARDSRQVQAAESTGGDEPATGTAFGSDETGNIAAQLASLPPAVMLASFFGFGLLLAFTPCVFPMVPIVSGIIVGQRERPSRALALTLTLVYVLAMALTYALAGVAAGLSGAMLQAALQHPAVLVTFALVFVALALSLFGFYELQLPSSWQTRLNALAGSQRGGQFAGVAVMGVLSALIVGPCVAPPLAGALLYIAQTGDAVLGGAALFALGLGMGAPLIAVGIGAREVLPKSGPWMTAVKNVMGALMLALAWWIVRPVVFDGVWLLGWAVLALATGVMMGALEPLPVVAKWPRRLAKALGLLLVVYGVAAFVGVLAGGRDPLQPLKGWGSGGILPAAAQPAQASPAKASFDPVKTLPQLQVRLAMAEKPVLVKFTADWCVSCAELERFTFPDAGVQQRLVQMERLLVDVTANSAEDRALLQHFQLFGPPALLLFDRNGQERRDLRVVGFIEPELLVDRLDRVLSGK